MTELFDIEAFQKRLLIFSRSDRNTINYAGIFLDQNLIITVNKFITVFF